jgi:hypothetical protein
VAARRHPSPRAREITDKFDAVLRAVPVGPLVAQRCIVRERDEALVRQWLRGCGVCFVRKGVVRAAGVEPALCRQNWILSPIMYNITY